MKRKQLMEKTIPIKKGNWYVCVRDLYNSGGGAEFVTGRAYLSPKDECLVREDTGKAEIIGCFLLSHFRPWTVQDAKPGDFLTYKSEGRKDWYFIYQGEYSPYECHYHYYAAFTDGFIPGGTACIDEENLRPSTSKERNLLLQKIELAGYLWDSENLKLTNAGKDREKKRERITEIICHFEDYLKKTAREKGYNVSWLRKEISDYLFFNEVQLEPDKKELIQTLVKILRHDDEGIKNYVRQLIEDIRDKYPLIKAFEQYENDYLEKEKDEILCVYDRHAGLVDGAQWQKEIDREEILLLKDQIESLQAARIAIEEVHKEGLRTQKRKMIKTVSQYSEEIADALMGETEEDTSDGQDVCALDFRTGIWFAVDYLVRHCDIATAAVEILNSAGISRKDAMELWKESDLEECDYSNKMERFLKNENFSKE